MAGQAVIIPPNHHVCAVGINGSGKSRAVGRMLMAYSNVIALDTKGDSDGEFGYLVDGLKKFWPDAWAAGIRPPRFTKLKAMVEYLQKHPVGWVIYRPDPEEMTLEYYEALFKFVYDRKHTILWIDEVYSVVEGASDCPFWLKALMTRGRSRWIGVWCCTQRPKDVPNVIFSESKHFYVFRLNLEDDRKKVAGWAGKEVMVALPGDHGFWYWNFKLPKPVAVPYGYQLPKIA